MSLLEKILKLVDLAKVGDLHQKGVYESFTNFADGKTLYFEDEDVLTLKTTVREIWKSNKEIFKTVTEKKVKECIIEIIRQKVIDNVDLKQRHFTQMIDQLLAMPVQECDVFKPLYGAMLSDIEKPLILGPYTIYDIDHQKQIILGKYPKAEMFYDINRKYIETNLLIGLKVMAREHRRAIELSESLFQQFDNVIKFIIGPTDHRYDIGIYNFNAWSIHGSYVFTDKGVSSNTSASGSVSDLDLCDPYFISNGYEWIWEKLQIDDHKTLETRILLAINWLGKGLKDKNTENRYVQFIFALESLFNFQKGAPLISPSIVNQLAEISALILGSNFDERIDFMRKIKKLYEKRSTIVHGDKTQITEDDVLIAYGLVKSIILKLVHQPELRTLKSDQDLLNWVNQIKYS